MPNAISSEAPRGRGRGKRTSPRKMPQTSLPLKKRATAKPAQQPVDSPDEENLNTNSPLSVDDVSEPGHAVSPSGNSESEMSPVKHVVPSSAASSAMDNPSTQATQPPPKKIRKERLSL